MIINFGVFGSWADPGSYIPTVYRGMSERRSAKTLVTSAVLLALLAVMLLGIAAPRAEADGGSIQGSSVLATWTCAGTPCPWGDQTTNQAAVWPAEAEPTRVRHGYSLSHDVYAAAAKVVGWQVQVDAGSAAVYAGTPGGSHSRLASLAAGESFTVPTLGAGVVVSLQGDAGFRYTLTPGAPPTGGPTEQPGNGSSVLATWTCAGTPCPWGEQSDNQAAVWPPAAEPSRVRHGYTVSHDVYAAAAKVVGWQVRIDSGSAAVYAGTPGGSHSRLTSLQAGESFAVPTLGAGVVVSVQGDAQFRYTLTPAAPTEEPPAQPGDGSSVLATWTCAGAPCPWGDQTTNQAAVWPAATEPSRVRLGYTVSHDVYAPAAKVAGWQVRVDAGSASVYAGTPDAGTHTLVATLPVGGTFTVPTLSAGVVVSVQGDAGFRYTLTAAAPPTEEPDADSSALATWTCAGAPCPWGDQTTNHAAVWPAEAEPSRARHGYVVSHDVYAAAAKVVGWQVQVDAGNAAVYAGTPSGSHSRLATLAAGESFIVPTLGAGVVVSVQSDPAFRYTLTPAEPTEEPTGPPACDDPTRCDPVSWVASVWQYNGPGPEDPDDWTGGVVSWPSWSAYASNNRAGFNSRTVYSLTGEKLYPYMGAWADGCEVEVVSGGVLIIEWQRGQDGWRETYLSTGGTHTIDLAGAENGAMIETQNNSEPFEIALSNCSPQQIDKGSSD